MEQYQERLDYGFEEHLRGEQYWFEEHSDPAPPDQEKTRQLV